MHDQPWIHYMVKHVYMVKHLTQVTNHHLKQPCGDQSTIGKFPRWWQLSTIHHTGGWKCMSSTFHLPLSECKMVDGDRNVQGEWGEFSWGQFSFNQRIIPHSFLASAVSAAQKSWFSHFRHLWCQHRRKFFYLFHFWHLWCPQPWKTLPNLI